MTSSIPDLQNETPETSPICSPGVGSGWTQGSAVSLGTPYPIGIVVDLDVRILVHGGEGHAVFQLIRQDPSVDHVVAKGIEQLDVDIAHQGVQHFLERRPEQHLGGCRPQGQEVASCYPGEGALETKDPSSMTTNVCLFSWTGWGPPWKLSSEVYFNSSSLTSSEGSRKKFPVTVGSHHRLPTSHPSGK